MLNVLFVTRKWPPAVGGMETYSLELSKELSKKCEVISFLGAKDKAHLGNSDNFVRFGDFLAKVDAQVCNKKTIESLTS